MTRYAAARPARAQLRGQRWECAMPARRLPLVREPMPAMPRRHAIAITGQMPGFHAAAMIAGGAPRRAWHRRVLTTAFSSTVSCLPPHELPSKRDDAGAQAGLLLSAPLSLKQAQPIAPHRPTPTGTASDDTAPVFSAADSITSPPRTPTPAHISATWYRQTMPRMRPYRHAAQQHDIHTSPPRSRRKAFILRVPAHSPPPPERRLRARLPSIISRRRATPPRGDGAAFQMRATRCLRNMKVAPRRAMMLTDTAARAQATRAE